MKIAVISDIHAHIFALKAVLEDMPPIDHLLCAGDITGYHRNVNEVMGLLRRARARMILGNHDYYVFNRWARLPSPVIVRSVLYTKKKITPRNLALLKQLPQSLMLKIDGVTLHMFHGSPRNPMRVYYFAASTELQRCAAAPGQVIIMGHTHRPFIKMIADKWILNPGSVGQPRDDNNMASYALIDTDPLNLEIKLVDCFNNYDWSRVMISPPLKMKT